MGEHITNSSANDPCFTDFKKFVNDEVHAALTLLELTNLEIDDNTQLHPTVLFEFHTDGVRALGKHAMALYLYCGAEVDRIVESSGLSRQVAERNLKKSIQAFPDSAITNARDYWKNLGSDVKHVALQYFDAAYLR